MVAAIGVALALLRPQPAVARQPEHERAHAERPCPEAA